MIFFTVSFSRFAPSRLSHLSPLNGQECRTSSCLWKGVALQGGVAATLAGVALHCATVPLGRTKNITVIFEIITFLQRTRIEHKLFSLKCFGRPRGYPAKHPGISSPKVWFSWVSKDIPNFLAPTPSPGRTPPHPKISGPKVWVGVPFSCLILIQKHFKTVTVTVILEN